MLFSFQLLINDHFHGDFLNKLYILSTFSNILLPFQGVHFKEGRLTLLNHEQLFDVNQNLLVRALRNPFPPSYVFFLFLHGTTKEYLAFIKATADAFVISVTCTLFGVD